MFEKRCMARFVPQAWINGYAVAVDPEGPTEFDVTPKIERLGRDLALKLRDDSYETDELRELETAPLWVRNWPGPFVVEVEQSIAAYFAENAHG